MPIYEMENGTKLEFDKEPTPEDLDAAVAEMMASKENS